MTPVYFVGIPAPLVHWYLGSKEIKSNKDFLLKDNGHEYTLHISKVTEIVTLKGISVAARNKLGEERRKVDIRIYKGKPYLSFMILDYNGKTIFHREYLN